MIRTNRRRFRGSKCKKFSSSWNIIPRLLALESRDVPAAFTPGDLVLVREGDNSQNMTLGFPNGGNAPIYLDEYTPAGILVQTVQLPTGADANGNLPISFNPGNGTGNGQINLSADSSVLTLAGDAVSPGTTSAVSNSANRVIAQIGIDPAAAGAINTQTNGLFGNTDDDRAVVEANPNSIYVVNHANGSNQFGGVRYINGISTVPNNGVQTSTNTNVRGVTVGFDGRLYWTTGSPSAVYTQQDALPTTLQPSDVQLFANPTGGEKLDGLFLADMNGNGILDAGDRMYYVGLSSGLDVSVYNGTSWGTPISLGNPAGSNLIGLAAEVVSPTHVVLFGTTYPGAANTNSLLVRYDDIGSNPNAGAGFTTVLTLPTTAGQAGYRGVSFVPVTPTEINLTSTTAATTPGGSVTFNATLSNASGSLGGMTVNFIDNSNTVLATKTVQPDGTVSFTTTSLPVGANSVKVYFAGSQSPTILASNSSNSVSVQVTGTNTVTTSLASAPNPSTAGQTVTFTVMMVGGTAGTATGTITFTADSSNILGTATLTGGTATLTFSALTIGVHPVTAHYSGDANYQVSNGSLLMPQEVNAGATISISSSNAISTPGTPVTFTATVTGNGINAAPTGNVSFFSDGQPIGSGPVTLIGNQAQLPALTSLTAGSHLITATYNGDMNYGPVTSSQFIQNVQQAFAPGDLIVTRLGDFATQLGASAAQVYLDEYTPSGTLVQSIAMPNTDSGSTHILSLSGSSSSEGALALSANGRYLTLTGYDAAPGTPVVTSTDPATTPRTVARIDSNSALDTSTALTIPSGNAFGSVIGAVTNDGQEFWIGGDGDSMDSGLQYAAIGTVGTPSPILSGSSVRAPIIFNGQLYVSSSSNSKPIATVGTGLPTSITTTMGLPGVTASANSINDPQQFLFFRHDGTAGPPDLLYIADLQQGLLKYAFDGTNWDFVGVKRDFAGGVTGITGYRDPSTGNFVLFGTGSKTSQGASATNLFMLTDSAPFNANFVSGNVTELTNISANGESFRGIAFAPTAAPTVAAVQVNDGSAERSEVRSISVTFSGPVTFSGGNANAAAAFQLQHVQDSTNINNLAAAVTTNGSGQTVVTLTFTTTGNLSTEIDPLSAENPQNLNPAPLPSLADGRYQLTIVAANVSGSGGLALNGGNNYVSPTDTLGGGAGELKLYRLFGDTDGSGIDDQVDLGQFRSTLNASTGNPLYISYLDADNSGTVDQVDLGQFRSRLNANVF